ncbi:MAG: large conductance mechanosensitive channel, partial [Microbacteriaceae bacterium]|nr:large conductance mechanosensitive channel [Microbacteriaceae bacterium]
ISALFKADSLNNALKVKIGSSTFLFGEVLGAMIQFVLVAVVVYFVFVFPLNHFKERVAKKRSRGVVDEGTPTTELDLLIEIRDLLAANRDAASLDAGTLIGTGKHSD